MGLVILEKKEPIKKLKCTIQKSGRLAFPEFTSRYLGISLGKYLQFATDQTNKNELYIIINSDFDDKNSYKIYKSGQYYYVLASHIFMSLGYKYDDSSIIFDLKKEPEYKDLQVYKLIPRL